MAKKKKRVFLVDGSGLVYRAHFAMLRNPLITTSGEVTSAVYGFLNALLVLLRDESPDELIVAFDVKGKTFRHERYDGYKANRPPAPPELRSQIPRAKELLDEMQFARVEREGVEADDLIGSLARQALADGKEAVIVSADKDFFQLIRPGVRQWVPPKMNEPGKWIDAPQVREKYDVDPEQMRDLLALMGDSSDNVPGVAGVGVKTAAKLLGEHGTLDAILEAADDVPQKGLRKKLQDGRDDARLSQELVTIRDDLEVDFDHERAEAPELVARPGLVRLLRDLEFQRVLDQLGPGVEGEDGAAADSPRSAVEVADDLNGLGVLAECEGGLAVHVLPGAGPGFGSRGAGGRASEDPATPGPFGIALGRGDNVCFLPLADIDLQELRETLIPLAKDGWVGHDIKADLHVLGAGPELLDAVPFADTMIASYLLDPETSHAFEALALSQLDRRLPSATEILGVGKQRKDWADLPIEEAAEFAGERARINLELAESLQIHLEQTELLSLWQEMECPLIPVLFRMETAGIALDTDFLESLSVEMKVDLERLTEQIHEAAGREFNIGSPLQLSKVLFEELKLPKKKKTKTGFSTDHEVLEKLAELHPVPRLVLEHRSLSKLKGTYVDALPELVDSDDGRIHASFHQAVAATGRLSSSDPNIQNIPIRSETGRRIREAFVAPSGRVLISADYSQVELRILAHISKDEGLREAFESGYDVHTATAARLFGVPPEEVGVELRSRSKAVNFGVIYGMGPQRLSREMGISMQEAKDFIADYFAKMPGVKGYLEGSLEEARSRGYTTTIFGRRRYLPGLQSEDHRVRAQAERICSNTPIQGSAADIIKEAMLRVDRAFAKSKASASLLLQVHDELVVECDKSAREEVEGLLVESMTGAADLVVPLEVELGSGRTWGEAHG